MRVIVEQSKTDIRSVSVFSRSCSLAAWPFMSKPWISTERATVWGRLWCHFAVHCVTKKKKKKLCIWSICCAFSWWQKGGCSTWRSITCTNLQKCVCLCVPARVWQRLVRKRQHWSKGWTFIKTETRAFRFAASGVRQVTYPTLSLLYCLLINRLQ